MASLQAERQLILLSAGTGARREAMSERARLLMADIDWARFAEILRMRKLLPVLGPRILELSQGAAGDDFAVAVDQALESGRRQGAFLQLISLRVSALLADVGIRSAPLKGPLLGEAIYGDPGRRLSSDIDLLVAPEQLHRAVEVVRGLGYGSPSDHVDECGLPLLHFALVHEREELPPVELHWRIHWYERSFACERLLAPMDAPSDWRPERADELAALLLFYARDGFIDLRLATDLSAWWDVYGEQVPRGALNELLRMYPALARALRVSVEVAERIVGLPSDQALAGTSKLSVTDRLASRLANPNPHISLEQLYADRGLIDGLLAPRGGFGEFVRRQVLLPREILDERAGGQPRGRVGASLARAWSTLARCGVLGRYGLALARLVRSPETLSSG